MEDNNTNPITPQEFAKKIKSKYPQYKRSGKSHPINHLGKTKQYL
jgi:hypothetical protein